MGVLGRRQTARHAGRHRNTRHAATASRSRATGAWRRAWIGALALAGLLGAGAPDAGAATLGLRQVGTGFTTINASEGQSVSLELFLDTQGLSFEGYLVGLDIDLQGGSVSAMSVTHQPLAGLFPDLFGAPVVNDASGTIRNDGQTTLTTGLPSGVYILDIISLTIDSYGPSDEMIVTPGLYGEVLGLGGGGCPGTTAGCSVGFESASIIPEPSTALLLGLGLMGLAVSGRDYGPRKPPAMAPLAQTAAASV